MLQRKLLLGTSVIAGLTAMAAVAAPNFAFAAQASTTASDDGEVEAVVVTGSRIRRNEYNSAAPVQIITAQQAELKGIVDTSELLQTSSTASGSYQINNQLTGYITDGGPGGNSISLRGLGSQRTLILLNGRRAGPAGISGRVGPFDLNVIPQGIVDRVEILKDGASSIYGSDAVAGVINIITKTNLDGAEVNAYASQPFEKGGEVYRFNAALGKTFERGYINGAFDIYQQKALRRRDRDDTACAADYLFDPNTGARVDWRGLDGKYKCYNLTNGYVSSTATGTLVPTVAGVTYPTAAQGNNSAFAGYARTMRNGYPATFPYGPTDTPLYGDSTTISPVDRYTVTLAGGYDIAPNVEAYGEFLWNRRKSSQIGVGQIFQSFAQRNIVNGAPNNLPASNPNNPFGTAVQTVTAYRSVANQEVDYYRVVGGLRGTFNLKGNWDWDLYGQYSKSDGTYDIGERVYLDRFLALNSPGTACSNTPVGGNVSNFSCSSLPNGIPWASARVLNGQFTDAEKAFLFFKENNSTTYTHQYVEGSLSGDLFTLPAGVVSGAFGFQFRKEEINDTPGPQALLRNVALYTSADVTRGSDSVKEAFAEFEVPLLKGLPGAESLSLNLSGRYSDYKSYGSSSTYKVGVNWQIVPSWRLRLTQGTSFRAPALYELYLGNQTGYNAQSVVDPCYNYGSSSVSSQVAANCAALGIDDDYVAPGSSSAIIYSNGGRDVLKAEESTARTIGLVWTPSFVNLNVALDYFEFDVSDEVRQFGAYNILYQCLNSPNYPNSPYCSLFQRDPTSKNVTVINNSYVNVAEQNNRGIDLTAAYRHDFSFGRFAIDGQFTWQLEDTTMLMGGTEPEDYNGSTTEPDFTGQISARFERGDWTVNWSVNMIGKASDTDLQGNDVFANARYADLPAGKGSANCAAAGNYCVYYKQYTEFTSYHSASVRYEHDDWTVVTGINNVFDERPPAQSTGQFRVGTAALNLYDMIGRRAFLSLSRRW